MKRASNKWKSTLTRSKENSPKFILTRRTISIHSKNYIISIFLIKIFCEIIILIWVLGCSMISIPRGLVCQSDLLRLFSNWFKTSSNYCWSLCYKLPSCEVVLVYQKVQKFNMSFEAPMVIIKAWNPCQRI